MAIRDVLVQDSWNIPVRRSLIQPSPIDSVLSISLCFSTRTDCNLWILESSRNFSLKSAVQISRPRYGSRFFCTLLWDVNIPLKIFLFMWKLSNDFFALDTIRKILGFQLTS